ncbi:hypothetical protein [Streptomyces sp. NPDC058486]|uniref:hypothetical protein n=1 Tax=unclassified Streptomyces TaxID=2593676 RepID=UPI00365BD244
MRTTTTGRGILRQRAWGSLCALLGLLALAAAYGLGATLPAQIAAERAYLAAGPCPSGQPATDEADCLRAVHGTVESTEEVRSGKTRHFRVWLRPPAPAPLDRSLDRPLDLSTTGELSQLLEPGDEVELTAWRDVRVSVLHAGVREDLDALPDGEVGPLAGVVTACVWFAVAAFIGAYGGGRRARRIARGLPFRDRIRFGPAKIGGVLAVPLLAGFASGALWDGWTAVLVTAAVTALIGVQATVFVLRVDR